MSKYRHWWRPTVEKALKQYPQLKAMKADLQSGSVTANYSGMPRSGGVSRTTEVLGTKHLSQQEELLIYAVDRTIKEISRHRDGADVLKIVDMVDFKQSHTMEGAALALYMHRVTASDKRTRFVDMVGKYMGFTETTTPWP